MKKYLEEFHQLRIFQKKDALSFIQDDNAAKELLRRYKKLGLISQIRRDLYTVTDLAYKTSDSPTQSRSIEERDTAKKIAMPRQGYLSFFFSHLSKGSRLPLFS